MRAITEYTLTCAPDGSFWYVYETPPAGGEAYIGAGATARVAVESAMDVLLGDAWEMEQEAASHE